MADALSHIRVGLEISPPDPDLNRLNAAIASFTKVEATLPLSAVADGSKSTGKEEKAKQNPTQ